MIKKNSKYLTDLNIIVFLYLLLYTVLKINLEGSISFLNGNKYDMINKKLIKIFGLKEKL